MDLSKWNVPVQEKSEAELQEVELKRLKIIADMAAALVPELDALMIEKNTDHMAGLINQECFNSYERRLLNLKKAFGFGGYTPDENGKMCKTCPATEFNVVKLRRV